MKQLRWMIRSDVPQCSKMNKDWSEDEYMKQLRQRNVIGKVVVDDSLDKVYGHIIYELHKTRLEIVILIFEEEEVAIMLIDDLIGKVTNHSQRSKLSVNVYLERLELVNLFKKKGFIGSLKEDDVIEMIYSI